MRFLNSSFAAAIDRSTAFREGRRASAALINLLQRQVRLPQMLLRPINIEIVSARYGQQMMRQPELSGAMHHHRWSAES
jgi:hypothetical protein